MTLDIEAIRQSPRQYVDLETVEALADKVMVLELELAKAKGAADEYEQVAANCVKVAEDDLPACAKLCAPRPTVDTWRA